MLDAFRPLFEINPLSSQRLPRIFFDLGSTEITGTATGSDPFQPHFLSASSMCEPPPLMDNFDHVSGGTMPLLSKILSLMTKSPAMLISENEMKLSDFPELKCVYEMAYCLKSMDLITSNLQIHDKHCH